MAPGELTIRVAGLDTVLDTLARQDRQLDPDEIRAIAAELSGNSTRLAEAVAANTPAGPESPTDEPTPEPEPVEPTDEPEPGDFEA